ncbi:UNVERIFIED_ORG: histidine transport system substrate-binding protein [Burkholderia sp. 1595]|jgi:histidine transport system substrate-binding protein|uniref:Histidine transport system substrate-binding protein n=1 Tax=Paraburkholderia terricola TaxID=169427 RepID=A0ABU1LKX0_9BURK|nr:histidine transport system substrate-binding protein [Paraburkholderia terricola]MDR6480386.1 histidine transport system substrate-binding protein [Paraburkholderia terricola]
MKKLALRVALAVTAGSAVATEWKTVRIGVDASYPPFESKAAGGEPQGLPAGCGIQST